MAAPNNPMEQTHTDSNELPVSKKTFTIAGIITDVFGLEELPGPLQEVACLWLLHPRKQKKETMQHVAAASIHDWNNRLKDGRGGHSPKGLIAVAFDQRNHGTRKVDDLANEAWRQGNPRHAQDMFSIFQGTAIDTSALLEYLSAYAFPHNEHSITMNLVLGVSLGAHAAWHCIMNDVRISTAIIVVGCPDYMALMGDRARKSKLKTWTSSDPPGSQFFGSPDFPQGLLDTVELYDPASMLISLLDKNDEDRLSNLSESEKQRLRPIMEDRLGSRRILNMAGKADKLVPYVCGEPFLKFLKNAMAPGGWFSNKGTHLEDIVFDGVGHEFTPAMKERAVNFISNTIADEGVDTVNNKASKM
ncbi:hypothetical protein EV356DRAFT_559435 [Viridothelium virens]|uniref:Alpha/beta-hydrolase n=1 Tax=Viridothelium virens TaxID=1048519 RepID=A0A6A6H930_VIRVR|nr:hypothetical protein EV356DRAFT_559435 [Viridothelium virens]